MSGTGPSEPESGLGPDRSSDPAEALRQLWRQGERLEVDRFLACAGPLPLSQLTAVLRVDQRERWQGGERVLAETYLCRFPVVGADAEQAVDLVYHEFLLREQRGEQLTAEEYVERFPAHAEALRQQIELHRAMAAEEAPEPSAADQGTLVWSAGGRSSSGNGEADEPALPRVPGYEVLGELGRGGMGVVYKARQLALNRLVALKMIRADGDPEHQRRLRAEAEVVARLRHPNVVQVYDYALGQSRPYLALEFVEGGTLAQKAAGVPQPPHRAAQMVETLAAAVHHAHRAGLVHRDLKPANVLLTAEGVLKIADFGLAKQLHGEPGAPGGEPGANAPGDQTASGALLGTPVYMAPEQVMGRRGAIGPATDVYALGVILYELLTGRPPFQGDNVLDVLRQVQEQEPLSPGRLQPGTPRDLETICLKCLEKDPRRRYPSAQALADDLRHFQAGEPIAARPVGRAERLWRWCRRNPALAAAGGLAGLALAAVVAVSVGFAVHARLAADRLRVALDSAEGRLAENYFDRAASAADRDADPARALLWLARALETAPDSATDLRRVLRANLAGCGAQTLPLRGLFTHPAMVSAAAISPDGSRLLTGAEDGRARLWDPATGDVVAALSHEDPVWAVAFGPDGRTALTASGTRARLWDVAAARPIDPTLMHPEMVWAVAFSPDGKILLTGCLDGTARVWRTDTGRPTELRHGRCVRAVAFAPDGKTVVTGGDDGKARLWDAATGKRTDRVFAHGDSIFAAAFSPDGTKLLTGDERGRVTLWDLASGAEQYSLPHHGTVWAVAFSPDGETFAAGAIGDQTVRLWDTDTGKPAGPPMQLRGAVRAVAFGPGGRTLLTGSEDKAARLWELPAGPGRRTVLQGSGPLAALAFSADGRTVATGGGTRFRGRAGNVRLWDAAIGKPRSNPLPQPGPVWAVAISPDETRLLAGAEDKSALILSVNTGMPVGHPLQHAAEVSAVAFSPDGRTALSGSWDGTARLWEVESGKPLAAPLDGRPRVRSVAFSPDGRTVLTGSDDTTARLWDAATGKPLDVVARHESGVAAVAFGRHGKTIATASSDRTARVWDNAGKAISPPLQHPDKVTGVALSPDGTTVLTAAGSTARLWDVRTGKVLGPPVRHPGPVAALAFRPDGRTFLTGSLDGTVRVSPMPAPVAGDVGRFGLWVRVRTGLELDESNAVHVLDGPTWRRLRHDLERLGGPPR
jgi:WD40 repeat protein/predicted Ser/Thr protein kinase